MKMENSNQKINFIFKYFIMSFFITWALVINIGTKTSNIISILIFLCSYYFIDKVYNLKINNKRIISIIVILSIILSIFQILGNYESFNNRLKIIYFSNYLFSFIGFFILFYIILVFLYNILDNTILLEERKQLNIKYKLLIFIAIIILWSPYLLNYFPGITPWDTEYQLSQALGNIPLNRAHPIIHTLYFRLFYNIGFAIFKDENAALSVITIVQMLILSSIFTSLISYTYKKGFGKFTLIFIFIFYAVVPIISLYSINLLKDVLFSATFLVFCMQLWKYDDINNNDKKSQILYFIKLFLIGTIFCMMRNNAIFVFIALIPFILFYFKKHILFAFITVVLIFGTQKLSNQLLYNYFDVKIAYSNDLVEMVSIPIQQVSRVIKEEGKISSDDYELLSKIVNISEVKSKYKPYISDPIKVLIRDFGQKDYFDSNKKDFLKLWIRIGTNNFGKYVKAYIDQTKGYWYPDIQQGVLMTKSANKQPDLKFSNTYPLGDTTKSRFNKVNFAYLDMPIIGNFYSIAIYVWISLITLFFVFAKKKNVIPILPSIILWGTLLVSTPVAYEFRYAYPIIMSVPLYILVMLKAFDNDKRI